MQNDNPQYIHTSPDNPLQPNSTTRTTTQKALDQKIQHQMVN
jgi:hypothetical protein